MTPTIAELHAVAPHLVYEIEMLQAAAFRIIKEQDTFIQNTLLESFTVHARALHHFFDPQPKRTNKFDDVLAAHFFDNPDDWAKARGTMPKSLDTVYEKVNKQIAHLTYRRTRLAPGENEWPIEDMLEEFMKVAKAFANSASAAKLPPDARSRILTAALQSPHGARSTASQKTTQNSMTGAKISVAQTGPNTKP